MCNQTEMYREIYEYDRAADRGQEHVRGIAHNPASCLKCIRERREARPQMAITSKVKKLKTAKKGKSNKTTKK